ncbi:MAG: SOS response-associated peptidase [Propionibacteriaceae bacterium]
MCGRYAASANPEELVEEFEIDEVFAGVPGPDFNVAPTVAVPAVLERHVRDDDGNNTDETTRRLTPLTWGLVPSWAKDRSIGSRLINARFETIAEKPAFKKAFSARRCLLPADGYYEWYTSEAATQVLGRTVKAKKQPFFIHRADGGRLAMAGLYEIWRDPTKDRDDETAWLRTCVVITTQATDAVGHIHDRMPMVVGRDAWDAWLDPALTDPEAALKLLGVTEPDALEVYAVSTAVNSVKNNQPSLLDPLPEEGEESEEAGPAAASPSDKAPPAQDTLL